jgi:hypothetical protein
MKTLRFFNVTPKAVLGLLCLSLLATNGVTADGQGIVSLALNALTHGIPSGPPRPMTGSEFGKYVAKMDPREREEAILHQILAGNVPGFLRKLVPVKLSFQSSEGRTMNATIFAMPEYLAIGTDKDFLRIPMNLYTAAAVASKMGFVLPTRKIVDAIYAQAAFHFAPQPMTAGPQMRSTQYYVTHNEKVEEQSRALGVVEGSLVSGDKKDVVVSNRLERNPGKIAIYGWHKLDGLAIQPLSTVHGACYADYSHGIRLVSQTMLVDGETKSVDEVLDDPTLSQTISDEGPIPGVQGLLERTGNEQPCAPISVKPGIRNPLDGVPRLPL